MKRILFPVICLTACASPQPAREGIPVHYGCQGSITNIVASYPDGKTATLTMQTEDGKPTYTLKNVPAASGSRYTDAKTDPAKPGSLIWWSKGSEAKLYVVTTARPDEKASYNYEKQLASCTTGSAPQEPERLQPLDGSIPGTAPGPIFAPKN